MIRIESTDTDSYKEIYIVNGQLQKAWNYIDSEWSEISGTQYQLRYNVLAAAWKGYVDALAGWNGSGDYTYTQGDATVRISNISVNPSLADSMFEPDSVP